MRKILFRGKRKSGGEWISGHLIQSENTYIVIDFGSGKFSLHEVIPESVGIFTGLTDKNGCKIFEGDIIKLCFRPSLPPEKVVFEEGAFGVYEGNYFAAFVDWEYGWAVDHCEIISNIHDNSELLNGKEHLP